MPQDVTHQIAAETTRSGDRISTENGSEFPYGATVQFVERKARYVYGWGHVMGAGPNAGKRDLLFRLPRGAQLYVVRSEPTPEELAERRAKMLVESADDLLTELTDAYPKAKARAVRALAEDRSPDDDLITRLMAAEVQLRHANRMHAGIKHHAETGTGKTLVDLFRYLHDELVREAIERTVPPAKWSGGFTVTNARAQVEFETNAQLLRQLRRTFGFGREKTDDLD